MAIVKGMTAARVAEMKAQIISSATLVGLNLVLHRENGDTIDLGRIKDEDPIKTDSLVSLSSFDSSAVTAVVPDWNKPGVSNVKLANPSSLPGSYSHCASWSPDGRYLSLGLDSTPYILTYKRSGDVFTKLSDPTAAGGIPNGISWSPNGQYLALAHATSPYLSIYKRSGDTLTKLSNPGTLPTGVGYSVSWDYTSTYLAIAHASSPYVTIYKRSGDTFTKLTNPGTLPAGDGKGVSFESGVGSGSSRFLVVSHNTSPYVTVYDRSGDSFTKLTDPASLPAGQPNTNSVAWSRNGLYFAVVHATSPFVTIYKKTGATTFTKLPNPDLLPPATAYGVAWSPDNQYLLVSTISADLPTIYKRSGDLFEPITEIGAGVLGGIFGGAWSPDGFHLALTMDSSPNVAVYKAAMIQPPGLPS